MNVLKGQEPKTIQSGPTQVPISTDQSTGGLSQDDLKVVEGLPCYHLICCHPVLPPQTWSET